MTEIQPKHQLGFSIVELIIVLVIIVVLGAIGWAVYRGHHKTSAGKTFANYTACIRGGGQALNYDGAIQFDACKGSGDTLFLQYSAQNLPRIDKNRTTTTPNVVVSGPGATSDLIRYLTYSDSGCNIGQPAGSKVTGYFKIAKEIPSGWALLKFGCSNYTAAQNNASTIIAIKLSSSWVQLSPTNNFRPDGTPSCLLVDMFRIPGALTDQCYQNTGYSDGSLRSVDY